MISIPHNKNGLFWSVGAGKTMGSLNFGVEKGYTSFLVVCPKILKKQWESEIQKYNFLNERKVKNYFIVHPEEIKDKKGVVISDFVIDTTFVIVDECHKIYKNFNSQRTKNFYQFITKKIDSDQIVLLSATPIKKDELDIFSFFKICNRDFVDCNNRLLDSFAKFKRYFFEFEKITTNTGRHFEKLKGFYSDFEKELFYKQFNDFFHTVNFEANVSVEYTTHEVEESFLFYEQYENLQAGIIELLQKTEILSEKITILNKLRQFCDGFLYTEKGEFVNKKNNKVLVLRDILENIFAKNKDDKVIVLTPFIASRKIICDYLQEFFIDEFCTEENIEDFIQGKYKILISSQNLVGVGLNLQCANHLIFYSNDYDYSARLQAEGRILRQGQLKPCFVYDIMIKKSYDQHVYDIMTNKKNMLEAIKEFCLNFNNTKGV